MAAGRRAQMAGMAAHRSRVSSVPDLLDGQLGLDLERLDRVYLNGHVPNLQVGGQVVTFLTRHLGNPIPSPALFTRIGERFRAKVNAFAQANHIPVVRFGGDDREADVMRPYLGRAAATGRSQVVAIGISQEFQRVFTGYDRAARRPGPPQYGFEKADRRVSCVYFYLWDDDFGPAFIKVCSYFPYPIKVWVNRHEWAKRQAGKARVGFLELSNGFAAADDPAGLQDICDRLGPGHIQVFFERWLARLPVPLSAADRDAGYWWELSMRQLEVSRTLVFRAPRYARAFFESLVGDSLGLGRPDEISLIFDRQIRSTTDSGFATRVVSRGVEVTVNFCYQHSRIKQYLKDGRAVRVETVVNSPTDLGRQHNLRELQRKARDANRRLVLHRPAPGGIRHPKQRNGRVRTWVPAFTGVPSSPPVRAGDVGSASERLPVLSSCLGPLLPPARASYAVGTNPSATTPSRAGVGSEGAAIGGHGQARSRRWGCGGRRPTGSGRARRSRRGGRGVG